jgi:ABC-type branched-subunit amino acid transport system ATPase component
MFDFVDLVYVMHLGRVLAHGTPAEVADDPQVREVYFGE